MYDILDKHLVDPRIDEYLERIFRISKSYSSKRTYKVIVNRFMKFLSSKNDPSKILLELKEKREDPIIILDDYYTFLSKEGLKNSCVTTYICIAKDFLNFHGMHIYSEDLKQRFRLPKKEAFYEEGLSKAILIRLLHNSPPKLQVAILMICSGGMRNGELVQLRISDIDFTTNPTTIRIRRETTKTRETRFTHITTEASKALSDYITKNTKNWQNSDPYLFMNHQGDYGTLEYSNAMFSARGTLMNMLRDVVLSIPELAQKNENGNYMIHFHAFRKWFKTQVTNAHQSDFAEALMGHKSIKLTYYKNNSEARMKTYQELEPYLTISDFTKVEKSLGQMQEKIAFLETELEKVKQQREIEVKYQRKN